jgi:flagellar protein FliJ
MKKFSFPLESVLKYRKILQDQAELELGRAMAAEHQLQVKLDGIALQYAEVKKQTAGSKDFTVISTANQFYALLDMQKELLFNQMAEAKVVSEQKRKLLQDAVQKTQSLEKLRSRLSDEWKQAAAAEDEDLADDVNNGRRFRR